jgi:hypothetical protein
VNGFLYKKCKFGTDDPLSDTKNTAIMKNNGGTTPTKERSIEMNEKIDAEHLM